MQLPWNTQLLAAKAETLTSLFTQLWVENPQISSDPHFHHCHRQTTIIQGQVYNGSVQEDDVQHYCRKLIELVLNTSQTLRGNLFYPFQILSLSIEFLLTFVDKDSFIAAHIREWGRYYWWLERTTTHMNTGDITIGEVEALAYNIKALAVHLEH